MIIDVESPATFCYFVKIIPQKKSDAKIFEWHDMQERFNSLTVLKRKLKESFNKQLPFEDFEVGYIAKKGNRKRWIIGKDDLVSMYKQAEHDAITLFCEVCPTDPSTTGTRKRRSGDSSTCSNYAEHEQEVKRIALDLSDQHGNRYNERQFRLWASMIVNGQHSDHDKPPNIPLLTGGGAKKMPKKDSLTEAITNAATAFASVMNNSQKTTPTKVSDIPNSVNNKSPEPSSLTVSPRSKAQLSGLYIAQLKDLQSLLESGVLTVDEFKEQKEIALQNIRNKLIG